MYWAVITRLAKHMIIMLRKEIEREKTNFIKINLLKNSSLMFKWNQSKVIIKDTPSPQGMKSELTASYLDALDMAEVDSMLRLICQFSWLTVEPLFL